MNRGFRDVALAWTLLVVVSSAGLAEDWPTYRHDVARTGVTPDKLAPPLAPCWTFQPRHAPQQAWGDPNPRQVSGWYGSVEGRRMHFDSAFHVVVAGRAAYFASSADGKVTALDAETGQVRWSFFTGGPVRLAPTVAKGRVYVGCDDGFVYCLQASDGGLVWRFRAAPSDRKVLGSGKMISLWPVRTDVAVDGGVACFGAGVFPAEGVYMYAVGADDGKLIWSNDTGGSQPMSRVSPQGYLLLSKTTIFAPQGRVSPATFARADGKMGYQASFGHEIGGTFALLAEGKLVTGTKELVAFDPKSPSLRFAYYLGRQVLLARGVSYVATEKELAAYDNAKYPKASIARRSVLGQLQGMGNTVGGARTKVRKLEAEAKADPKKEPALAAAKAELAKVEERAKTLLEKRKNAEADVAATALWSCPSECWNALIMADGLLVAGGKDKVEAVDAATGKPLWSAEVVGTAEGLTAAAGRLFVSTDTGAIYCFGPQGSKPLGVVKQAVSDTPFPRDQLTFAFENMAQNIFLTSGISRGYCLVLGNDTGRLAYELSKLTELTIYAIEPDAAKVAAARKALDAAGLYGSRIWVEQVEPPRVPYSDYFANLIVSESALTQAKLPYAASEAVRMLRPMGGKIVIGQDQHARGKVPPLPAAALEDWLHGAKLQGEDKGTVVEVKDGGVSLQFTRGPLPGAGSWTHEYANPANTTCGDDELVKCPLRVLWFGDPGPADMVERHPRAAGPLSIDGRMFIQGYNVLMAYDAYNGLKLWERRIQGAMRVGASHDSSNLVANADALFAVIGSECLRIDPATGETKATYKLPPAADGKTRRWGYLATVGGLLYGSLTTGWRTGDAVFAIDLASGGVRWVHQGRAIAQGAIAIGDGIIWLADTPTDRGLKPGEQLITALDAATGKTLWEKPVDLAGCSSGAYYCSLGGIYSKGVLVYFGVFSDGHYWQQFFAGKFGERRVVALSAKDGGVLWDKRIGYRVRPLVVGDTFHAEPWAFDLHTGQQRMQPNAVTGIEEPWQWARPGHHCGCPAASPHALFFRSYTFGYYDLDADCGTMHFGGQRPGCWINFIPANGLLLMPEASSGCLCPFPNMCTVVFEPAKESRAWGYYSMPGPMSPVKHIGLNLGAPGDRRDPAGTLWLGYPRPGGSLVLRFNIGVSTYPGGGYFERDPERVSVGGTDAPWLFRSGIRGPRRLVLPLVGPGEGAARYTVRLAFAELEPQAVGKRFFDVKLQGKPVLKSFDVAKEAGGIGKAIVKEFKGIEVADKLLIDFAIAARKPTKEQLPIVQAVEVEREEVLSVGLKAPSFFLNDEAPEQEGQVQLANFKAAVFEGTLRLEAPDGFTVTPAEAPVKLASGRRAAVAVKAAVAKKGARGKFPIALKLVRADGTAECEAKAELEYLANWGRVTLKVAEDAYVSNASPDSNYGTGKTLLVDGGDEAMGDESHQITYLKFRLDVPGKPVSAVLRIYNAGNPTGDSGNVCPVAGRWEERKVTYDTRPKLGKPLARIGPANEDQAVVVPLTLPLEGLKELSLAIDPVNCDGVDYISREGGKAPELIIDYEPK